MHQKKERKKAAPLHLSLTPKHLSINSLFLRAAGGGYYSGFFPRKQPKKAKARKCSNLIMALLTLPMRVTRNSTPTKSPFAGEKIPHTNKNTHTHTHTRADSVTKKKRIASPRVRIARQKERQQESKSDAR